MGSVMKMASFSMNVVWAALFAVALATPSQAQQPNPQYNVITDAVLFDGGPSLGNSDRVRWDFYKADRTGVRTDENATSKQAPGKCFRQTPRSSTMEYMAVKSAHGPSNRSSKRTIPCSSVVAMVALPRVV